jgi:hypothetical protein
MEGLGSHRELDDSSRALDGLNRVNAVTIRKELADVTCDSELWLAARAKGCHGRTLRERVGTRRYDTLTWCMTTHFSINSVTYVIQSAWRILSFDF